MFALFGRPVLLLLLRFRDRFTWQSITALPISEARETPGNDRTATPAPR